MNIWKVVHPFERSSNFLIHEEGAHSGGMVHRRRRGWVLASLHANAARL